MLHCFPSVERCPEIVLKLSSVGPSRGATVFSGTLQLRAGHRDRCLSICPQNFTTRSLRRITLDILKKAGTPQSRQSQIKTAGFEKIKLLSQASNRKTQPTIRPKEQ